MTVQPVGEKKDLETIGFVEAHGTGTPVGDPIEVAALSQAFQVSTKRRGYCALGSVKTNVGHLETAAGVAGHRRRSVATPAGAQHAPVSAELPCPPPYVTAQPLLPEEVSEIQRRVCLPGTAPEFGTRPRQRMAILLHRLLVNALTHNGPAPPALALVWPLVLAGYPQEAVLWQRLELANAVGWIGLDNIGVPHPCGFKCSLQPLAAVRCH